jgi:hypothetical protein
MTLRRLSIVDVASINVPRIVRVRADLAGSETWPTESVLVKTSQSGKQAFLLTVVLQPYIDDLFPRNRCGAMADKL